MAINCVFCEIIRTEKYQGCQVWPAGRVAWFRPLGPVTPGHMLFVPFAHVIDAASDTLLTGLTFQAAARYGREQEEDFNLIVNCGRNAEQSIFHLHVHYVPRRAGDGLDMPWTKQHDRSAPVVA